MPATSVPATTRSATLPAADGPSNHRLAIASLLLLSPLIGEVLSGATRISFIFAFIPEIMVWGCGALLIREAVRRWRGGWISVLSLGLALSVAEEFIIQQTSLAPLNWMGATSNGRLWGVNLFYFLFMLGYESVWIVLVPIQITELIFPQRREQPWLRTRGIVISALLFVLGAFIAWFLWIKQARPKAFHVPDYNPPLATFAVGIASIVALVFVAYRLRTRRAEPAMRRSPGIWRTALTTVGLVLPWYVLMVLMFIPKPVPAWPALIAGLTWAGLAFFVIRRWSSSSGWQDMHRWALSFGALLTSMAAGFLGSSLWPRMDVSGKLILNIIAVAGMILLARAIRGRSGHDLPG
jgi:hypothetical protein